MLAWGPSIYYLIKGEGAKRMNEAAGGLFLSQEEVKVLFSLLKAREYALSNAERTLLLRLENALYACLSVDEVEALLSGRTGGR
jgi:hypothetical protein